MNAFAFNTARASAQVLIEPRSPTTARLLIYQISLRVSQNPDATVVPALVLIFDSEVTSLECVTTRPLGYVLPSSSHTFPRKQNSTATAIELKCLPGFPNTKPEAQGTDPKRMFAVRHRLLNRHRSYGNG